MATALKQTKVDFNLFKDLENIYLQKDGKDLSSKYDEITKLEIEMMDEQIEHTTRKIMTFMGEMQNAMCSKFLENKIARVDEVSGCLEDSTQTLVKQLEKKMFLESELQVSGKVDAYVRGGCHE